MYSRCGICKIIHVYKFAVSILVGLSNAINVQAKTEVFVVVDVDKESRVDGATDAEEPLVAKGNEVDATLI